MENKGFEDESFRDSIATVDKSGKRVWIHALQPAGKYYNARTLLSFFYLAIFFTLPFIKVQDEPFMLFNVLERKFILFGHVFGPQDFLEFGLIAITGIIFIALFTVVYGRIFCGWVCPQTVFLEMVFRRIEYMIDGNPAQQKNLKAAPWSGSKIFKRALKHGIYYGIAVLVSNGFLAYIIGFDELWDIMTGPFSEHVVGFIGMLLFSGVFYFVFSWFREQACLIVCPYGRLQGVLLDKHSVVIAYDHVRGEPRGKGKRKEDSRLGDCIDCYQCVKVCPTGIDIRNGTQLECVNCTACIDACDHIMESVDKPTGLIRYDSMEGINSGKKFTFTTRMKAYTAVLVLLIGIDVFMLLNRNEANITILRAGGMLFQEQPDGRISNLYNIMIVNHARDSMPVSLKLENIKGEVKLLTKKLTVPPEQELQGTFFIILDKSQIHHRKTEVEIGVYSGGQKVDGIETTFLGPS